MRARAPLLVVLLALWPAAASAGGYGYGGFGYSDRDLEFYCARYYGTLHGNYREMQRSYDRLQRRLATQTQECAAAAQQQQQAYQQIIDQHRSLNADLADQQDNAAQAMQEIADAKGIPAELLQRPTREEYDDLQERYDALLQAYRNLERDYRALGGGD